MAVGAYSTRRTCPTVDDYRLARAGWILTSPITSPAHAPGSGKHDFGGAPKETKRYGCSTDSHSLLDIAKVYSVQAEPLNQVCSVLSWVIPILRNNAMLPRFRLSVTASISLDPESHMASSQRSGTGAAHRSVRPLSSSFMTERTAYPRVALIRRTPAEDASSFSILKTPISPVRVTCGPPQTSLLK